MASRTRGSGKPWRLASPPCDCGSMLSPFWTAPTRCDGYARVLSQSHHCAARGRLGGQDRHERWRWRRHGHSALDQRVRVHFSLVSVHGRALIMGYRLDTIGIAGFSHDFGSLSEHVSPVLKAFNDMHASEQSIGDAFILLFWTFFSRACLSTPRQRAMDALSNACSTLARELCDRVNADGPEEISVLGLLGELVCQPGSVIILTTRVQSRLSRESRTVFSRKSSLLRSGRRS
jgi:hypothetical protein